MRDMLLQANQVPAGIQDAGEVRLICVLSLPRAPLHLASGERRLEIAHALLHESFVCRSSCVRVQASLCT